MTNPTPTSPFEAIKQLNADGHEFWSARDLMPLLEYTEWRNLNAVIEKAKIACEHSQQQASDHFVDANKMVTLGSGSKREVPDYHLSRYACYLIVQNADPSKQVVALGQTYFAMLTWRQELADQQKLSEDHGYRGLYNGLTSNDIHSRKGLNENQNINDHMSAAEFAANAFRITQTEAKLKRENVHGQEQINQIHHEAGQVVRRAIAELGGTMPEDMPTVGSIKKIKVKPGQPKLLE